MAAVDSKNEQAGEEDHSQDDHAEQPHERDGAEGALVKESVGERVGYRGRLSSHYDG